jgi:predicted PurR-regulated permease PerM
VPRDEFVKRVLIALALTGLAILLAWTLYLARGALLLIYISVVLAIGFDRVVRTVERQRWIPVGSKRLPRWLAILVVYVLIIGAAASIVVLVATPIAEQASQLWEQLPRLTDRAQAFLVKYGIIDRPFTVDEAIQQAPGAATAVGTAAVAVTWTLGFILDCITVLILTFYLLVESDSIYGNIARFASKEQRPRVVDGIRQISTKVSAWLGGQLILSMVIGTSAALALWALGVPFFYVLALIAAVGEMIPVLGPLLSAVPAILVALTVSPQTAVWVALFFLLQQQLENNLLVPKIMERQVGVNPIVVLIALMIGAALLGIPGAILAVPTAAILQVVMQQLLDTAEQADPTPERR